MAGNHGDRRAGGKRPSGQPGFRPGSPARGSSLNRAGRFGGNPAGTRGASLAPRHGYATREEAQRRADRRSEPSVVIELDDGRFAVGRAPKAAVRRPQQPKKAPGASSSWRKIGSGLKAFPRDVAVLIVRRDEVCQRCASPGPLHKHHRRAKGIGGDTRPHSQCACNGVLLCSVDPLTGEIGGCHRWAHLHPEQARAEGWIVSQEEAEPSRVGVMRYAASGSGVTQWPTCDGEWAEWGPESGEPEPAGAVA